MSDPRDRIREYLEALPPDQREALETLRHHIEQAVPDAVECVSYGIPAFCVDGRPLVSYGAGKNHCAFYPMAPEILDAHVGALTGFETSKGTVRFQPERPLPPEIVRSIVLARVVALRQSD